MNRPKKTLKGDLQQAKADCPDRVQSDQMGLGTVSREAGPHVRRPKALKTKLAQGWPEDSSSLRSNGSCDSRARGWTS
jgi:hypothetical protein